jgi:hypothetical protein
MGAAVMLTAVKMDEYGFYFNGMRPMRRLWSGS